MTNKKRPETETPNDSQMGAPLDRSEISDISPPSGESINDNLVSAVDAVMESDGLAVGGRVVSGVVADASVLVRLPELMRDEWKVAAGLVGLSVNAFVRECVGVRVDELLRCSHPSAMRQSYVWQETCLLCGVRLRDGVV